MQITMQSTRLSWPAETKLRMTPDCSRIAKKMAMMSGLFVEGKTTRIRNDQKNLRRKQGETAVYGYNPALF